MIRWSRSSVKKALTLDAIPFVLIPMIRWSDVHPIRGDEARESLGRRLGVFVRQNLTQKSKTRVSQITSNAHIDSG